MYSTSSSQTTTVLRWMVTLCSFPEQLVSDNATQFTSDKFCQFFRENGVKHTRSVPYYTNGLAERLVQSVKRALKAGQMRGASLEQVLSAFVLQYRTTPHVTTGDTPSSLLLGRDLRTHPDLLRLDLQKTVRERQGRLYTRNIMTEEHETASLKLARRCGYSTSGQGHNGYQAMWWKCLDLYLVHCQATNMLTTYNRVVSKNGVRNISSQRKSHHWIHYFHHVSQLTHRRHHNVV